MSSYPLQTRHDANRLREEHRKLYRYRWQDSWRPPTHLRGYLDSYRSVRSHFQLYKGRKLNIGLSIVEIEFSMGLWPAFSIRKSYFKPSFSRASSIGTY